jgi:hypothetical protein
MRVRGAGRVGSLGLQQVIATELAAGWAHGGGVPPPAMPTTAGRAIVAPQPKQEPPRRVTRSFNLGSEDPI